MAKKKVTEESLRIGQTVYSIWKFLPIGDFEVREYALRDNSDREFIINVLNDNHFFLFYSKSKARTKMNKLNEEAI
jgi:hypothetical protein